MNSISAYIEMLLRKHECVVLPGFGAFLCNYVPARFADDNELTINPPSRCLAFNGELVDSDGLLASSIARKEGLTYEAAVRRVNDEVELLRRQLDSLGELQFGNLGIFHAGVEGQITFVPNRVPSVNGFLYGLKPVELMPLDYDARLQDSASVIAEAVEEKISTRGSAWRAYATGIVASLAVIVTAALFLISPIRVDRSTRTASMAPVPSELRIENADAETFRPIGASSLGCLATLAVSETGPVVSDGSDSIIDTETEPVSDAIKESVPVAAPARSDTPVSAEKAQSADEIAKPADVVARFNESDSYCVIVASFPTRGQADEYIASQAGNRRLGILEKDNRFRVYAATAATYREAGIQKELSGQDDAWVCRR